MAFNKYKNSYLSILPNEIQDFICILLEKENFNLVLKELKKEILNNNINYSIIINNGSNNNKYNKAILFIIDYYKKDNYSIPFIDFIVWLNHYKPEIGEHHTKYIRESVNDLYSNLYLSLNNMKTNEYFKNIYIILNKLTYQELLSFKYFIINN